MKHKRIYSALLLLMIISILNGCVNATYKINLKDNGTIDVKLTMIYNDSGELKLSGTKVNEIKEKFINSGYEINDVSEKGLSGFEIIKKDIPLDDAEFIDNDVINMDLLDDILAGLTFTKTAFRNYYTLESVIDLSNLLNQFITFTTSEYNISLTDEDYKKYLSQLNLKLVVSTEHGEILRTNSTLESNDKGSSEWVLIPGNVKQISVDVATGYNKAAIGTVFIIAVVAFLAVYLLIVLILRFKKRS